MPRKGTRHRLDDGISKDATGYSVRASVGTGRNRRSRERRFPLTLRWPEDAGYLKAQRAQLESELRDEATTEDGPAPNRGTWAADVLTYLKKMKPSLDAATYKSRASELKAWTAAIGDERSRYSLRKADVQRIIDTWKAAEVSPKTILNRVRTFKHVYRTLDSKRARTPADDVRLPARVKTRPRDVDRKTIRRVIANLIRAERRGHLRDSKTRARFLVRITTGQRPSQIMRAKAADVDFERRIWWVPAGKGGDPVPLYLNNDMLNAWTLFAAANAWGDFDTRSAARVIHAAGWPKNIRVYNARHTVGIALSERGEDIGDIQAWLGLRTVEIARAHYVPELFSRMKAMSERLDGHVKVSARGARYAGTPPEQRRSFKKRARGTRSPAGS